jgi:hypothetical protein
VTLAGPESAGGKEFFDVARKVAARAQEIAASSEEILEMRWRRRSGLRRGSGRS